MESYGFDEMVLSVMKLEVEVLIVKAKLVD